MKPIPREYAVGFLNYNTKHLLLENLARCVQSGLPLSALLVWDNQSEDKSIEAARERFPQIRAISSDRNLGYAGGMNGLVHALDTKVVILVTADCYVTRDTVEALLSALESGPNIVAAGCRLLDLRTGRIQSEGGDITFPLGVPLARRWQESVGESDSNRLAEVGYLDGAILAVDRDRFLELGGFDGFYFAYQEDVDFCWRARTRGYRIVCTNSASASHVTSASFRRYPMLRWSLSERNRIANNIKNLQWPALLFALFYEVLYFGAITAGTARRLSGYQRAYYQGIASLLRGVGTILASRKRVQNSRTRPDREVLMHHPKVGLRQLGKALLRRAALNRQLQT